MSAKDYYRFTGEVYVKDPDTIIAQGMEFAKVTRCKECVFMQHQNGGGDYCEYMTISTVPENFCSWGERRG